MSILLPVVKVALAAAVIVFASWLSGKRPELAGFIIALPVASLLALAFSYAEHGNAESSITFAKSILVAVPASYLFFIPFFFSEKFGGNFWLMYISGFVLLLCGYLLHRYVMSII